MRKIIKESDKSIGKRTKTRFLFLPRIIKSELRWLEKATWVQWRTDISHYPYNEPRKTIWIDAYWVNE